MAPRASTATRSAPRRSWRTSRASPPCRGSAPRCRAWRRCGAARSASAACRTGPPATRKPPQSDRVPPAFDHLLTRTDPEKAHHAGFRGDPGGPAARPGRRCAALPTADPVEAMGITFPQPARPGRRLRQERGRHRRAGARSASATSRSAPSPASRSPATRRRALFRLPADRAVVNRMGFNNDGAEVVARRLRRPGPWPERPRGPGAGRQHRQDQGRRPRRRRSRDYEKSAPGCWRRYADYLVVNVSSPNTPGLRDLQAVEKLEPLLRAVRAAPTRAAPGPPGAAAGQDRPRPRRRRRPRGRRPRARLGLDGIIATNTTISRDGPAPPTAARSSGSAPAGSRGAPLTERSLAVLLRLLRGASATT